MPLPLIPRKFAGLLALPLLLSLASCGAAKPRLALPPVERAEPVALPVVPVGSAVCADGPCLSDSEMASLVASYDDALREADRRLSWLKSWITTAGR